MPHPCTQLAVYQRYIITNRYGPAEWQCTLREGYHHKLRPEKMLLTKGKKKQTNVDLNPVQVADTEFVNVCSSLHRHWNS